MKYKVVGKYKKGKKDGTWTHTCKKQNITKIENYENGLLEGLQEIYHANGRLAVEYYTYKNNTIGEYRKFYDTGVLGESTLYNETGSIFGESRTYYPSGNLKRVNIYKDDGISIILYYDSVDNKIKTKGQKINDIEVGEWITYYEDGKILSISTYEGGEYNFSKNIYYYPSGNIKLRNGTLGDVLEGSCIEYYDNINNSIMTEGNMSNDVFDGSLISYYENGVVKFEMEYTEGLHIGNHTEYYDNKNLKISGKYVEGREDGIWTYYHKNGKVKNVKPYSSGTLQGNEVYYYFNGEVKYSGMYHNNIRAGRWTYFYNNGVEKSEGYFDTNNRRCGPWKFYDEKGDLIHALNYVNGEKI